MVERVAVWAWHRFRPQEGWLPLALLLAAVAVFVMAILEANWVAADKVVRFTAFVGFAVAFTLAKKGRSAVWSWSLIVLYACLATITYLIRLSPILMFSDWRLFVFQLRESWLRIVLNLLRWTLALIRGGQGQGTTAFTIMLGILSCLLVAYLVWSIYRQKQPLRGFALMGLVIGLNVYFGGGGVWNAALFVGLAFLTIATLNYVYLERRWIENKIDYSEEIKPQLVLVAGGLALLMLLMTTVIPALRPMTWVRAFQESTAVQQVERRLEQTFGGIRAAGGPGDELGRTTAASGIFPRDYLLGDAPELAQTPIFAAQVLTTTNQVITGSNVALHWRANSYDIYTGLGWQTAATEVEIVDANTNFNLPELTGQTVVTQTIRWELSVALSSFYMLGFPQKIDYDTELHLRPNRDFARLETLPLGGVGLKRYTIVSQLTAADPAQLRQSRLEDIPAELHDHYTQLPENISARVLEMGRYLTAAYDNPYDRALAIETFLRQYPYSLNVAPPPPGAEPVDYFLFELQEGYCDYYASAMVVLARSVGLPARLGVGYLAQRPDAEGWQHLTQKNGHSWAEIYFAGYGWVEFEPTATFPVAVTDNSGFMIPLEDQNDDLFPSTDLPAPPPIPEQSNGWVQYWQWAVLLLPLVIWWLYWWYERQQRLLRQRDDVVWGYNRLQKMAARLGSPPAASDTPQEFTTSLIRWLAQWQNDGRWQMWLSPLMQRVNQLTHLYERRQFDKPEPSPVKRQHDAQARTLWRAIERPLWRLWWQQLFRRNKSE